MPDQADEQTRRARELRRQMPPSQRRLWNALRRAQSPGIRFRREAPIHPFYGDIYCHAARLLIEVDGTSHDRSETDAARDLEMKSIGVKTLRVPARAIQANVDSVVEWILRECDERIAAGVASSPSPLARLRRRGPLPKGEET